MNVGIPEIMIVAVIIMLFGTPALLAVIFLALRRAAGTGSPAASAETAAPFVQPAQAAPEPAARLSVRAAGHIRADGSLLFAGGGLQTRRVEQGVYQLLFDGIRPGGPYVLHATPLADQPGDPPALAELLSGPVRDGYLAAGADDQALLVWLRLPDQRLVDRGWMVQIIEAA